MAKDEKTKNKTLEKRVNELEKLLAETHKFTYEILKELIRTYAPFNSDSIKDMLKFHSKRVKEGK